MEPTASSSPIDGMNHSFFIAASLPAFTQIRKRNSLCRAVPGKTPAKSWERAIERLDTGFPESGFSHRFGSDLPQSAGRRNGGAASGSGRTGYPASRLRFRFVIRDPRIDHDGRFFLADGRMPNRSRRRSKSFPWRKELPGRGQSGVAGANRFGPWRFGVGRRATPTSPSSGVPWAFLFPGTERQPPLQKVFFRLT